MPFGFAGAVMVAQGEMLLLNKGAGFADRIRGFSNTAETVFDIGSITRQFTASVLIPHHRLRSYPDESSAPPGRRPGPLLGHLS